MHNLKHYVVTGILLSFIIMGCDNSAFTQIEVDKTGYYYIDKVGYIKLDVTRGFDTVKLSEGEYIVYNMPEKKGKMIMKKYANDKLVWEGRYLDSPDLFKRLALTMEPSTFEEVLVIMDYYHPLKDGKWMFYNENEAIIKIEKWENGILVFEENPNK